MGNLIYLMNVSLDGFIETPDHRLDWTVVDDETHRFFAEQTRGVDAALYGRHLYELMSAFWPTGETNPQSTEAMREFARAWNAMPKIVFSSTLTSVEFNSRLAQGDIADELAGLRREFAGDFNVCGPMLASAFIRRGLVDEYRLVVHPVVLGAGTPYFPDLQAPIGLRLLETHRFGSGALYLRYEATNSQVLPS